MKIKSPAELKVDAAQTRLRELMLVLSAIRKKNCAIEPQGILFFETDLHALQFDLDQVAASVRCRDEELCDVISAANLAIDEAHATITRRDAIVEATIIEQIECLQRALDRLNPGSARAAPLPIPGNVLVFTGSYRPQPANDAGAVS
jgi:hypothetical protein